jgi:hypothetical protein
MKRLRTLRPSRIHLLKDRLSTRLERNKNLLLAEQKRQIEDLKKRMKRLGDVFAV